MKASRQTESVNAGYLHPLVRPLRERRLKELHKLAVKTHGTVRAQAILDAANLASSYNCASTHSHDLGDCILAKLNLLSLRFRIRRNPCRPNAKLCDPTREEV